MFAKARVREWRRHSGHQATTTLFVWRALTSTKIFLLELLRGQAKKWAKEKFRKQERVNRDTGRTIEISANGIGHAISTARNPDVIHSMPVLPEMIERMKFVDSLPPKPPKVGRPPDRNLLGVEIYQTQVQVRGVLCTAEFVVKIEKKGKRQVGYVRFYYYNHKLLKGQQR